MNRRLEFVVCLPFLMNDCGFLMIVCGCRLSLLWHIKFSYELLYDICGSAYVCFWLNKLAFDDVLQCPLFGAYSVFLLGVLKQW